MTSSKRIAGNPVKGWFYAAKYNGSNGDLVLGRVRSVRTDGEVILTNLLTGNRAVKGTEILLKRNHKITKKEADALQALYNRTKDKTVARAKTRERAVALWESKKNSPASKPSPNKDKKRKALVRRIRKLSEELATAVAELTQL